MFGLRTARSRAILGGVVLLVLLASVATLAVWRAHDDQRRHHALEQTSAIATALEHARAQFFLETAAVSALIFTQDPVLAERYEAAAAELRQDLSQARTEMIASGKVDDLATLDRLTEQIDTMEATVDAAMPVLLAGDQDTVLALANTAYPQLWTAVDGAMNDLEALADAQQSELATERAAADRAANSTLWLLIGFSAAAFVVAAGTVAMLIVSVIRPLTSLRATATAITAGDLEARAKVYGPEEVASLARDFNEMTDALSAKTQEYVDTTNLTGDIIVKIDKHGRWAFLNDAACQFYGKQREELLGTDSRPSLHPEDKERTSQMVQQARAGKELVRGFVNRQITPMGTRVVEWNGNALFDGEGEYAGIQGTGRDITERKQMEEALRLQSEITQNMAEAVYLIRASDGVIVYTNPAFERLFGYGPGEMIGKHVSVVNAPTDKSPEETAREITATLDRTGVWRGEILNIKKDGTAFWSYASVSTFDHPGHGRVWVTYHTDVTERKRAEEALRESEQRFRDIADNALEWIWQVDADGKYIYASPVVEKVLGYGPQEILGKHFYDLFHPEDREELKKAASEAFGRKGPFREFLNRNVHKNGSIVWLSTSGAPILDGQGNLLGYRGADTDVTDRKRAEEALRESEERLRILFEFAPDAYYLNDLQGKFVDGNKAAEEITGYTREELIGKNILELKLLPPEQIAKAAAALARHAHGKPAGPHEFALNRKDGSQVPVEIRAFPVKIKDQTLVLGIARDISERKRAEEERERLHAELELRAITDSLTGLYDHAHFYQRLAEEIDRSKRYNHGFAMVMMDVDDFKRFNDSRGHQAGDEMLRLVADCIRSGLRSSDLAFRYGGDEFAAILPHANASKARTAVDRINRRIIKSLKQMDGGPAARLSLSAGIACFPDDGITADGLVSIADAVLYGTKWVARARDIMGQREDIQSLVSALVSRRAGVEAPAGEASLRPEALHEQHARIVSSVASSIAVALKDAGVAQALEDPDMQILAVVGAAAEIKDRYIRGHPERTSDQAVALAEKMGLSPKRVKDIRIAGLLHDIGKVTVSEGILNKPGKLTKREFAAIKDHPIMGATLISQVRGFERLVPIVRHHHERFDGKGYPDGLAGEDIPPEARILSVVDVFDAMTHQRSYRKALSREKAISELERAAGTQFDAAVVKAFLALVKRRGEELAAPAQATSGSAIRPQPNQPPVSPTPSG